jgi:NTP pyrophosphatase (non-canonical NTP hydrolase)
MQGLGLNHEFAYVECTAKHLKENVWRNILKNIKKENCRAKQRHKGWVFTQLV